MSNFNEMPQERKPYYVTNPFPPTREQSPELIPCEMPKPPSDGFQLNGSSFQPPSDGFQPNNTTPSFQPSSDGFQLNNTSLQPQQYINGLVNYTMILNMHINSLMIENTKLKYEIYYLKNLNGTLNTATPIPTTTPTPDTTTATATATDTATPTIPITTARPVIPQRDWDTIIDSINKIEKRNVIKRFPHKVSDAEIWNAIRERRKRFLNRRQCNNINNNTQ